MHKSFDFSIEASVGSTVKIFGQYQLRVGCYAPVVSIKDNALFNSTGDNVFVGQDSALDHAYTFETPNTNISWCTLENNSPVNDDGKTRSNKIVKKS